MKTFLLVLVLMMGGLVPERAEADVHWKARPLFAPFGHIEFFEDLVMEECGYKCGTMVLSMHVKADMAGDIMGTYDYVDDYLLHELACAIAEDNEDEVWALHFAMNLYLEEALCRSACMASAGTMLDF